MKFIYHELQTESVNGMRFYQTPANIYYPSITTVLGNTIPEEKAKSLKKWQDALGKVKANKITNDAAHNGTQVHLLIERFLKKEELIRQNDNFSPVDISGFNALKLKLKKIDEVWGQEIPLYSDALEVAGRCDCVGIYRGKPSIIDFKTSIRLKNEKQIEDYRLQICAYAIMHNELFQTQIHNGVILMTSAGGFPQEFSIDLSKYVEQLTERIRDFYQRLYRKLA